MANIFDALTGAGMEKASADQIAAINAGLAQQAQFYGQGRGAVDTGYTDALGRWTGLMPTVQGGATAYANAVGALGQPGLDQARTQFFQSPQYQWNYDQMIKAANAAGNAGGVAIGNTAADVMKRGGALASGEWDKYVQNLLPYVNQNFAGTQAMSGLDTNRAAALANLFATQGNTAYQGNVDIGKAQAQGDLAGTVAGGNWLNLGTKLASAFAGPISGGLSSLGGALGTGLFNLGSGQAAGSPLVSIG